MNPDTQNRELNRVQPATAPTVANARPLALGKIGPQILSPDARLQSSEA
jgi:hypothetical protein